MVPTGQKTAVQRSELAVPASNKRFLEKAAQCEADSVFLDLEDAIAPNVKETAREMAIVALDSLDWAGKQLAVRVNGLDTPWGVRDIVELACRAPRLDLILVPKVASPSDVRFVEQLISGLEREAPRTCPLAIEVLIETASGLANVEEIAAASTRLEAMIFGLGDYSIDMRTYDRIIGKPSPRYGIYDAAGKHLNDQWHFAMARIANACRAHGLRAIDGPFADLSDPAGYREAAVRATALGFEGKWAIHPSQVPIANEVFSPTPDEIRWANGVVAAMTTSIGRGVGAIAVDGVLLDLAHLKMAKTILDRAGLVARAQAKGARA
jgi:malyl-CoA/(S)-citramalyl-CoA lyase